uniref:Uncharacterized protein n=1 Tax=Anguilla anguilla TaxID=7936 RepID=A0A0E9U9X6_ANGAN
MSQHMYCKYKIDLLNKLSETFNHRE